MVASVSVYVPSIGVPPVAYWSRDGLELVARGLPPRSSKWRSARPLFDPRVALVKFYPSMPATSLEALLAAGLKGLIIEGTGLGHVSGKSIAVVRRFIEKGGIACMTSQCVWGRVDLNVYETGRDLLQAGVVPLEDMLPETALVKLMWSLANAPSRGEAERLMGVNLAGETTERSLQSGRSA